MKNLIIVIALLVGIGQAVNAQEVSANTPASQEDYDKLFENYYNVEFREKAFKSMELAEDQIVKFDPLYKKYISEKKEIIDSRFKLIEKYKAHLQKQKKDEKKQEETTADFIENYWETQIAEMELKKDFFDRFEDVVSNDQAINFFLLEEKAQSRFDEKRLIEIVPMMVEVRTYTHPGKKKDSSMKMEKDAPEKKMSENSGWTEKSASEKETPKNKEWAEKGVTSSQLDTLKPVQEYANWVASGKGDVNIDHHYTQTGLEKLLPAIESVAQAHKVDTKAWEDKKQEIQSISQAIRQDPNSTDHADMSHKAFTMAAQMINEIHEAAGSAETQPKASAVTDAANAIKPDKLMTDQATEVKSFFKHADKALTTLSKSVKKSNNSQD